MKEFIYLCSMTKTDILDLSAKALKSKCGVYLIECQHHMYVGSSKNLYYRLLEHKRDLINGCHSNSFMQKACNKYSINLITYSILEECAPEIRCIKEKEWMNKLNPDLNLQIDPILKTLSKHSRKKIGESVLKGRAEGKYKTKYDFCEVEHYDYLGNVVTTYLNKVDAAEKLGITKKLVQDLASGYKKGLVWKGIRLRYKNSSVPPQQFPINPQYIGKHYDFYHETTEGDKFAFSTIKEVWAFLSKQVTQGNTYITIKIKKKDPTRSP